jgi:hypothetical protein
MVEQALPVPLDKANWPAAFAMALSLPFPAANPNPL